LTAAATLAIAPLAGFAFQAIGEKNLSLLNLSAGGIIGIYFVKGIFTYGQDYLSFYVSNMIIIDIRVKLFELLENISLDFYGKWHSGELISRVMNDTVVLQNTFLISLASVLPQTILLIGLLVYIFWLNWKLSLLTLISLPLIIQVIRLFGEEIRHFSERSQQKTADITSQLQEMITQIRVVKSFTAEEPELNKFKDENKKSFYETMKTGQFLSTQNPIIAFLQAGAAVGIVWYGGMEIINGNLTLPQLISFATALGIMTDPGSTLSKSFGVFQQGLSSAKRIFEILDARSTVVEDKNAVPIPTIVGKIDFQNVSFAYEKEAVIQNINLSVNPGETIALVGRTGAGKSTLVNLLPRFYDPNSGKILIDGMDIKGLKIKSLREQIALVPQEIALFRGTIKENIAYGKPTANFDEIENAAKLANADKFINALPEKYETKVGERGANLSGGERQRIAIARAILKDPRILILDEATSALDAETEMLIRDALDKLIKGRTAFIIAHRLYTVEKADKVIVMDNGKIVESGTHKELLAKGGLYKYLHEIQLQNKA